MTRPFDGDQAPSAQTSTNADPSGRSTIRATVPSSVTTGSRALDEFVVRSKDTSFGKRSGKVPRMTHSQSEMGG